MPYFDVSIDISAMMHVEADNEEEAIEKVKKQDEAILSQYASEYGSVQIGDYVCEVES